jgi:hypothetical protein
MSYVTGKIWRLNDGAEEADLLVLLEEQVAPRYAELHEDVVLGLLRLDDGAYLATQRWPDKAAFEAATTGEDYDRWLRRYHPVLALWGASATLEQEWAGEEIR